MPAPFEDMRAFLAELECAGDLQHIGVPVDREWEVGAICREVFDRKGPALVFDRVGEFSTPLVVGMLATRERYARALNTEPTIDGLSRPWERAYSAPVEPVVVSDAPCREVVVEHVDYCRDPFPIPRWHASDARYMLGTYHAVISQDPDSSWVNLGTYRSAILEPDILGIAFAPRRHIWHHWSKWKQRGKPMPVAVAIGLDPYLALTTVSAIPPGLGDYGVAGGLKGAPIELTKGETVDLLVPARAEIVIEGHIPTDKPHPLTDGPFGEFAGYMGGAERQRQFIETTLITHRRNPLFQGTYEARPPNESTTVRGIGGSMGLKEHLRRSGIPGVVDVCLTEGGCGSFHAVVSIKHSYVGHARDVMSLAWGLATVSVKHCIVVDEDIDPWNPQQVEWAVATRVQAGRDVEIIRHSRGLPLDPSKPPSRQNETDKMGIDATRPEDEYRAEGEEFPSPADPPQEHMQRVRARWAEYGFSN
ncbi:MAG TPA: UbiD family decarboxylase [Chloroflexota bacterium]|nr:UbiD family decarboxylase [Chloroflexota bacterium]